MSKKENSDEDIYAFIERYGNATVTEGASAEEKLALIEQQITACDESGFARTLESMVANVPANLHGDRESYYHSIMLMWMQLIGFDVHGEVSNNLGRSDIVWKQSNLTVVAEIKFHAKTKIDTLLKEAMAQIHKKRYYNRYTGKVLLLGIAFSGKNVGCRMEVLKNKN
jgi:hypothetical protein